MYYLNLPLLIAPVRDSPDRACHALPHLNATHLSTSCLPCLTASDRSRPFLSHPNHACQNVPDLFGPLHDRPYCSSAFRTCQTMPFLNAPVLYPPLLTFPHHTCHSLSHPTLPLTSLPTRSTPCLHSHANPNHETVTMFIQPHPLR